MDDKRIYEQLWREAQSVEVPQELSPERMKQKLEGQAAGRQSGQKNRKKRSAKWWKRSGFGSRAAAAAVVLVCSLGAYQLASDAPAASDGQMADFFEKQPSKDRSDEAGTAADGAGTEQALDQNMQDGVVTQLGEYRLARGYEELGTLLVQAEQERYRNLTEGDAAAADGAAGIEDVVQDKLESVADEAVSSNAAHTEDSDFSTTNLQVQGVDESDIVKTDGHYIYIADEEQVRIVDVSDGRLRQLGSITPAMESNLSVIREMYLAEDRLILLIQSEKVRVLTYDVTSPAGARLIGTYEQDGGYRTSRKIGDDIYLVTGFDPYLSCCAEPYTDDVWVEGATDRQSLMKKTLTEQEIKDRLPHIQGEAVPADCIYLSERDFMSGLLLSSFDLSEPERMTDCKLVFCGSAELYMTERRMIFYRSAYSEITDGMCTQLTGFAIDDGRITADCAESVRGMIQDTFAIHENAKGYLYVLTTDDWSADMQNRLYVLDGQLKIEGKIEHIADGEAVYAARFVDDIGYFVTYRNTDPLFTVDFSDPTKPELIGELEIPGFSDYLQFYDDTHLIGVGEERVGEDSVFLGIKVSLYDISDPTDVKECGKCVLSDAQYAPSATNYKAILADAKSSLVAFVTLDEQQDGGNGRLTQQIFTVDGDTLERQAADTFCTDENGLWELAEQCRCLYIGDFLYLVNPRQIVAYDCADGFSRAASCELD